VSRIIEKKVDDFIDTMIEDIQDIIKVEMEEEVVTFEQGILPPRYKDLKEELKDIIKDYIQLNVVYVGQSINIEN
jgi:hypothetical protein